MRVRTAADDVPVDVADLTLADARGGTVRLADLDGVGILVLMRHRH